MVAPDWIDEVVAGLPVFLTVNETLNLLRWSRRTFYRAVDSGALKTVRQTKTPKSPHLVPRAEIERSLREAAGGI